MLEHIQSPVDKGERLGMAFTLVPYLIGAWIGYVHDLYTFTFRRNLRETSLIFLKLFVSPQSISCY